MSTVTKGERKGGRDPSCFPKLGDIWPTDAKPKKNNNKEKGNDSGRKKKAKKG